MQSSENSQMVSSRSAGVPVKGNARKKGKRRASSPVQSPATPESKFSKANILQSNRALNNKRRETFLDDTPPPANPSSNKENEAGRVNRDSHDLSLSPRQVTRDSLVDNMLLSLDQFSFGAQEGDVFGRKLVADESTIYSNFNDQESYQPTSNFAARGHRPGGHGYSYSSDYEIADDSSRKSGPSRGRRSMSSSTFQPGPGRINNTRMDGTSSFVGSSRPPVPIPPRGIHSRSGMGSKGSSANSFDLGYAQVSNNPRWAHNLGGRSSSFDYGRDHQKSHSKSDSYDAAPMPTVPGGPRRARPTSPITTSHELAKDEAGLPRLERKRSAKSSKSAYKGRNMSNGGRIDYGLGDSNRELPPLPAFLREQASSSLVGYGKSKGPPSPAPSPQPPKERPGFFRRVFGSSRNNSSSTPEAPSSHGSTTSTETMNRPTSKSHIANQLKAQAQAQAQSTTSPREPPPAPVVKDQPNTLNKKPSSFFRRRKKSITEPEPPVPIALSPPLLNQTDHDGKPGPSPVSSLRKVMNPYLRSQSIPSTNMDRNTDDESQQHARGFSPDYEPDKSATIRTVRSSLRHNSDAQSPSRSAQRPSPTTASANTNGPDGTFLQDGSDDAHSNASKSALASREGPETTLFLNHVGYVTSETVKRDMALVAEYESRHSKNPSPARFTMTKPSPILESPRSRAEFKPFLPPDTTAPPAKEEDWVVLSPTKASHVAEKEDRVWLEPSSDEEEVSKSAPAMNQVANRVSSESAETIYKSAASSPIALDNGGGEEIETSPPLAGASGALEASKASGVPESSDAPTEPTPDETTPTDNDREKAQKIYDGNEDFIQKERAAAWMGDEGIVRARTLVAYLDLYDFANLNILAALRTMCSRLVLKGESQQVDRILDVFAQRWCKCNPNHGFKVTDVVHTICYSILLLNTDLHLADIDQKMTRSQFVKNTMPTIRRSVAESAPPDAFETRPSILPGKSQTFDSVKNEPTITIDRASGEIVERPSWRMSFKPPTRSDAEGGSGIVPTPLDYDTPNDDCGPLVKAPFHGTLRTWEVQVEIVLKDFYNSIRTDRLPLFGAPIEKPVLLPPSSHGLSVFGGAVLRRTPSVLSKAPSETHSYVRGRTADTIRGGPGKWGNKNRSRPRLYPGSSRTSLDDQSSMWSPSVSSSTWSKYSLGKTQTSMSVDTFSSNWQGDYQQSIGFANALSQAIIREETIGTAGSNESERGEEQLRAAPLLEDESLELAGAPWAKEGILKHKHHLESLGKKAKDRNWNEVFAVVEKGYLSLFSFNTKSMRSKTKNKAVGGVVGGGNWQENAENLGSFLLRQTIASALPSPGYSKARPHVWALSLPTGAVHLFQVGTPDIIKEFVSTANYWSARLSNHPLVGGISNIEYGWSDSIVNNALVEAIKDSAVPARRPSTSHSRRPSMQGSLRSIASVDQGQFGGVRSRLPGDRIMISDWTPPTQSMRSSNLMEADQLKTLVDYVAGIEAELQMHNQLRSPMLLAFTPRHPNSHKAMANWEKKSSYLLREIVKFRTYIDCLNTAETNKQRIYAERAERAAEKPVEDDYDEEEDILEREDSN